MFAWSRGDLVSNPSQGQSKVSVYFFSLTHNINKIELGGVTWPTVWWSSTNDFYWYRGIIQVCYKKQELLTLYKHLWLSHGFFVMVCVAHVFSVHCCFFVLFVFDLCFSIAYSRLPFQFSLAFIYCTIWFYTPTHREGAILQSPCTSVRLSIRSHFRNRYLSFYWKKWLHIYFLFTVRLTNERVGVFLAWRSVQHLVLLTMGVTENLPCLQYWPD